MEPNLSATDIGATNDEATASPEAAAIPAAEAVAVHPTAGALDPAAPAELSSDDSDGAHWVTAEEGEGGLPDDLFSEPAAEPAGSAEPVPGTKPPRPLVAGAFLRGEFEIKSLVARGSTNLYAAVSGDYGDTVPRLIAEREVPDETGATPAAQTEPTPPAATTSATAPALFPASEAFAQDGREYLAFPFVESTALQDYREVMNDERLLSMLRSLVQGLAELEARGLVAELTTDTLRVDSAGALRFFGFPSLPGATNGALVQLQAITDFLLKHVFADSSTMRLDDRYAGLALCDEVKELARRIDADGPQPFASVAEVMSAIDLLGRPDLRITADAALLSDVGQERELNEDAGLIVRTQRAAHLGTRTFDLYVVSDGMGGHEGGEVASDLTLSSLLRHLDALDIDWNDNLAVRAALVDVMDAVNADVVALTETAKYKGTRAKPGATLTFALRLGSRAFVCNVGDSRTYKFNERLGLQRVTKDHSYVQGLVDRGEITEDEAWDHPEGSIITAHIGYPKLKSRDVFLRLLAPGDTLLLVSDGVVDMVRDRDIEACLRAAAAEGKEASAICRDLIDASNKAGGFDNITALCVKVA